MLLPVVALAMRRNRQQFRFLASEIVILDSVRTPVRILSRRIVLLVRNGHVAGVDDPTGDALADRLTLEYFVLALRLDGLWFPDCHEYCARH